jgi:aldehyde dehydrogenase (NAD(P)+)
LEIMGTLGEGSRAGTGPAATSSTEIDRKIRRLGDAKQAFARLPPSEKASLLGALRRRLYDLAPALAEAACDAKGINRNSELYGEELMAGPVTTVHYVRLLERSLREIARHGTTPIAKDAIEARAGGSLVRAVPLEAFDRVRFAGVSGEVWLDVPPSKVGEARAVAYRGGAEAPLVGLVLGAGNVAAIPALDALHTLFVSGHPCLLKMSPVNAYTGPLFERALAPLIERGFLEIVYGGPEVGAYCTDHASIGAVHVTGSSETHDRIVWGAEPERSERKQRNDPRLKKAITSELGNITPVIVPPGDYSEKELDHLARSVAGMMVHNASFNCIAAKMLVLPRGSRVRDELLARLPRELERVPLRRAYYPGAADRYASLTDGVPALQKIGTPRDGELPWTLIKGLEPEQPAVQFRREPFCSILSEVSLDARDPLDFLAAAEAFANRTLWGSLGAVVIQPESFERDASLRSGVERLVERLEYGVVSVNAWSGFAFGLSELPWGAWPGSTLADVRSGKGFAHNALMLEHIQKVVLRAPLAAFPVPFWYSNRPLRSLAHAFGEYELDPGPIKLAKLGAAALKS